MKRAVPSGREGYGSSLLVPEPHHLRMHRAKKSDDGRVMGSSVALVGLYMDSRMMRGGGLVVGIVSGGGIDDRVVVGAVIPS